MGTHLYGDQSEDLGVSLKILADLNNNF
ncbi:hypothetical protein NTG1052_420018 [Candidatus Nitrotoga sp. 1052]|nr:hypothetical protein NTG1052_420018 [Candidatus Nitrotoga sp. 1052]